MTALPVAVSPTGHGPGRLCRHRPCRPLVLSLRFTSPLPLSSIVTFHTNLLWPCSAPSFVTCLDQHGGVLKLPTINPKTPNPRMVERSLEEVEVDQRDRHGRTALMWAADTGQVEAAEALLTLGADRRACDLQTGRCG